MSTFERATSFNMFDGRWMTMVALLNQPHRVGYEP